MPLGQRIVAHAPQKGSSAAVQRLRSDLRYPPSNRGEKTLAGGVIGGLLL
jgi:hypothetical protein